jgi:glycosyltransferase involved in cell wall biosynthesis
MKRLIRDVYGRDALVLRPPVSLKSPPLSQGEGEFYLVVSRLEAYKRVDLAVEAFNVLGAPLLVAGSGSLAARLKRLAKTNITFLGAVPDAELSNLYRDCRAVVCPQQEDFGLVALEANACGKPAICYGFGGATETMIPHTGSNGDAATAVFFYEQSISALVRAVRSLEEAEFRDETLQLNALRFHPRHFREEFMALANTVLYGPGSTETAEFSATAAR